MTVKKPGDGITDGFSIVRLAMSRSGLIATVFLLCAAVSTAQTPAFPGAEGWGRFVTGGRGGRVIEVTTLEDDGPGSLRAAIRAEGPRTVVFRISGTIILRSELTVEKGGLTVAGQTAPGDGICIRDYPVTVAADNVIIRFLRFRLGDEKRVEGDALSGINRSDIIIDHCSMSWAVDEVSSFYKNRNFTMQWCMIGESLNMSLHHKGPHGYGGIWGGEGATFHHNLLSHHTSRNPRFNGSRGMGPSAVETVDFRNNVIYNWGFNSSYGGEGGRYNIVANCYRPGPATKPGAVRRRIVNPWGGGALWYVDGNLMEGDTAVTADNWNGGVQADSAGAKRAVEPFPCPPVMTQTAADACLSVLAEAGAVLPKRDTADSRIVGEARTGNAAFGGKWGPGSGIIDSQADAGGWPELRSSAAPADSDHDGMPDDWELGRRLNPTDASDGNGDPDGDGYTNLEDYLNGLCAALRYGR
jgi:hypothetical protein